jgi:hypothetical protein
VGGYAYASKKRTQSEDEERNHFHAHERCTTLRAHVDAPAHVPPTA